MKNLLCAVCALVCATAFGQQVSTTLPAPVGQDRVQILSPEEMPLPPPPGEADKMRNFAKADDGISNALKNPDLIRQYFNEIEQVKNLSSSPQEADRFAEALQTGKSAMVPVVVKDMRAIKLTFTPSAVRDGQFAGVVPEGTIVRGAWTGAKRFFQLPGKGWFSVAEADMGAAEGMLYMNKPAINTKVAGKPAIAVVFTDEAGRRLEEVLWVNGQKLIKVTYAPDMTPGKNGPMKASAGISALSLASDLR